MEGSIVTGPPTAALDGTLTLPIAQFFGFNCPFWAKIASSKNNCGFLTSNHNALSHNRWTFWWDDGIRIPETHLETQQISFGT